MPRGNYWPRSSVCHARPPVTSMRPCEARRPVRATQHREWRSTRIGLPRRTYAPWRPTVRVMRRTISKRWPLGRCHTACTYRWFSVCSHTRARKQGYIHRVGPSERAYIGRAVDTRLPKHEHAAQATHNTRSRCANETARATGIQPAPPNEPPTTRPCDQHNGARCPCEWG